MYSHTTWPPPCGGTTGAGTTATRHRTATVDAGRWAR